MCDSGNNAWEIDLQLKDRKRNEKKTIVSVSVPLIFKN